MKTFFTVLAFCLIVSAFGIMIIGAWLEKGQLWVDLFATFFTLGAIAFAIWLRLENKEEKDNRPDIKFSEIKFKK